MKPARRALNFVLRAAVAALVLAPLAAPGQNLGRLALLSRLGEPLDAEIEVTAIPVEARDSLSAQIVPIGVFERVGVTPSPPLEVLRAAVERGADGRPIVRLKSTVTRAARRASSPSCLNGGRMVRQYSFNVDPDDGERGAPPACAETPLRARRDLAPPAATPTTPAATPAPSKPAAAAKPAPKPKAKVATKAARPSPSAKAVAKEGDIAASENRVKDLERTMRELQERIDARNREIEDLQRQVGGTAK
jgi:pilus assembly protein FimV